MERTSVVAKARLTTSSINLLLDSEYMHILKRDAVPLFSEVDPKDPKGSCSKIFEALNACFSKHCPRLAQAIAFAKFLDAYIDPVFLEDLCKSQSLK